MLPQINITMISIHESLLLKWTVIANFDFIVSIHTYIYAYIERIPHYSIWLTDSHCITLHLHLPFPHSQTFDFYRTYNSNCYKLLNCIYSIWTINLLDFHLIFSLGIDPQEFPFFIRVGFIRLLVLYIRHSSSLSPLNYLALIIVRQRRGYTQNFCLKFFYCL